MQRFKDWKNSTRAKFRKIKENQNKVGEVEKIKLSDLEERGMSIWGTATLPGAKFIQDTSRLQDFQRITNDTVLTETDTTFVENSKNEKTSSSSHRALNNIEPSGSTNLLSSNCTATESIAKANNNESILENLLNPSNNETLPDISRNISNSSQSISSIEPSSSTNMLPSTANTDENITEETNLNIVKKKGIIRHLKNLNEMSQNLLNITEKQMSVNPSLQKSVDNFLERYVEIEERRIKMEEEQIQLKKEKVLNEKRNLEFEIAKFKYLHPDFKFE